MTDNLYGEGYSVEMHLKKKGHVNSRKKLYHKLGRGYYDFNENSEGIGTWQVFKSVIIFSLEYEWACIFGSQLTVW